MLESKDKDQLLAIAQALGVKTTARATKATLINKILESTAGPAPQAPVAAPVAVAKPAEQPAVVQVERGDAASTVNGSTVNGSASDGSSAAEPSKSKPGSRAKPAPTSAPADDAAEIILGEDGEPLADWEIALRNAGEDSEDASVSSDAASAASTPSSTHSSADSADDGGDDDSGDDQHNEGDGESRNARRRRRRRGKNRDGAQGPDRNEQRSYNQGSQGNQNGSRGDSAGEASELVSQEPIKVSGYLDLRDEGYGFLRVNGYLASRDDAYIPVKLTRQYGLRKGDHVTGLVRAAGRNEKNPAMLEIHTINGADPEKAKGRRRFEDLTALFPDEKLKLENPMNPSDMTARIIDLVSPIGKGQRGIIVSPPKAGKTTIMKTIATAIEKNNPEVKLIVLLIDERPEEVTDMKRTVKGEVIASTFDRPSDEHTHVAELAIEKAKRLVEMGEDVVVILDGITRLSRAYNLAAPASGRILSGGIDAGALYPPKKFFGAARNVEEGGSLTILATALVETNSRMDEAIFEEFKGTGNMELRLDRKLSERRIYPSIDVDASSTRHEELLFDRKQLQMVWKLRRVLSGLAADGNAAPGLELLIDRLKTFRTNDEFLNEIAKQPSM